MEDNDKKRAAAAVGIALLLGVAALGFAIAAMQGDSLLTGDENANDNAAFNSDDPQEQHRFIDDSNLNIIEQPPAQEIQITEPDDLP